VAPVLAIGGIAGVAGARLAIAMFVPMAPAALPRTDSIEVNGAVLACSMAILVLTGLVAGILPALQAWHANSPSATMGSRSGIATRGHVRTRSALVVGQLALALPLLVGATALARSLVSLMNVDPGFRTENVVSLHMAIPRSKYQRDEQIAAFYRRIVDRVVALPGVSSAGMVNRLPLAGNDLAMAFEFEGVTGPPISLQSRSVTPDYFRTLSIPVREGRVLTDRDSANTPLVTVVDERLQHPPSWAGHRRRQADVFQLSAVHRRPDGARGPQPGR
jgi:hypothetical protein